MADKIDLIKVIARELHNYSNRQSTSKYKPEWHDIPHWKKLRYEVEATKMVTVMKSTVKTIKGDSHGR